VNSAGTKITGTFDLSNQPPGDYQVCVYNTGFVYTCGLTFTVTRPGTTTTVTTTDGTGDSVTGSLVSFETNPSGATIYLDNIEIGTSDFIYHDASPGPHKVLVRRTGYNDYSGSITVPDDERATFSADLTPLGSDTTVTSSAATPPETGTATPVTRITTLKKSTLRVPTTLPDETPTEESPLDPAVIAGTLCLMCLLLRNP
jgi:eukaryotic-like serine/threonine-protein kinase